MTPLTKPVYRMGIHLTRIAHNKRLVISLEPGDLVGVRVAKSRKTYYLPASAVFSMAVKAELIATRKAKAEERAAKRKSR